MKLKHCKRCHTNYGPHLEECPHCGHRKFKMRNIDFVPRMKWFRRIWRRITGLINDGKEVIKWPAQ